MHLKECYLVVIIIMLNSLVWFQEMSFISWYNYSANNFSQYIYGSASTYSRWSIVQQEAFKMHGSSSVREEGGRRAAV